MKIKSNSNTTLEQLGNLYVLFLPQEVAIKYSKEAEKLGISLSEFIIRALAQYENKESYHGK